MTLNAMIERAQGRTHRYEPAEAYAAAAVAAVAAMLIDIRSHRDRTQYGIIPGSVHVPRNVMEWRLAPECEWHNPHVADLDRHLIVVCNEGFSSLLAASALIDLGYQDAGDVIGGFEAWRAAGLPTMTVAAPDAAIADGMGPPDL
jgi:rhodanese-related sulfurtransferase